MRSYAMVSPTFWTRGPGKKLRGNPTAVALVLYLSTSPATNMIGLFYQPLPMICHDLGIQDDQLRALLALPAVAEAVQYDFDAELVWLPDHAREQLGDVIKAGDKRRPSIERELAAFAGHRFAAAFAARYRAGFSLDLKPLPAVADAPSEGLPAAQEPLFPSPSPSPSPVLDQSPDPDPPAREAPAVEPVWDERETTCPLDIVARLKAKGVHVDLATALRVDVDSVVAELEETAGYYTIGKGIGQTRRHWSLIFRERVRKRAGEGLLKAPGAVDHAQRGMTGADLSEVDRALSSINYKPPVQAVPAPANERGAVG